MTKALLLLVLVGIGSPFSQPVCEFVDLIELNHKYDPKGRHTFSQVIFYERLRQNGHYRVRDWVLVDDRESLCAVPVNRNSLYHSDFNVEVPRATIETIMKVVDNEWKKIIALARYGGLRTPSETLSLKWDQVDFGTGRLWIPEPKVEHHEGRGLRECPLFPELRAVLEPLRQKEGYVVNKPAYRAAANTGVGWRNANLRTQFLKKLKKANVEPWARLFHSMRASRQTELERQFPLSVVCAWLGNSPKVAQKSYLLVTESDWEKAQNAAQ